MDRGNESPTTLGIGRIVDVVLVEAVPLVGDNGEPLNFRIEIVRWNDRRFTCNVHLFSTFRTTPRFGHLSQADSRLLHEDEGFGWEDVESDSAEGALDAVLRMVEHQIGKPISRDSVS